MTVFSIASLVFLSFALLFFIVTLFTGGKYRVIFFNILFLILSYYSISQLIGNAKPVLDIPFYGHAVWDNDEVTVLSAWIGPNKVFLMLEEGEPRLYAWPKTKELVDALTQAEQEQELETGYRFGFKFKLKAKSKNGEQGIMKYFDDSSTEVDIETTQKKIEVPKPPSGDDQEIQIH